MVVCIVGAGNIGLGMAGVIALTGRHEVRVYTRSPFDVNDFVLYDAEADQEHSGLPVTSYTSLEEAVKGADYVFCTYPAFLRKAFVEELTPYAVPGMRIGFVPGYGGAEYMCADLIRKGVEVFGLQRVPFVARQEGKKRAAVLSRKKELFVASIPAKSLQSVCDDLFDFLGIPCTPLREYMAVTLAPSNPLLHLTGLWNVFRNWHEGEVFETPLKFYEEWNDETSEMLLRYDDELQEICRKLPNDMSEVVSLREYYESPTAEAMTKKLKSIKAFEVVEVPLEKTSEGYVPDFNSRMFVEDYPFGIAIIKYFAVMTDTQTPAIDEILALYERLTGTCYYEGSREGKDIALSGVPSNYGFKSVSEVFDFYGQE